MSACKRFLNVSVQTPNKMIYGDLGRYPMFITSAVRCVKYWLRITNLPDERLHQKAYNMLLYLQDLGKKTWTYHVKELLCRNGFGDVWLQQNVGHLNRFVSVFRDCWISSSKTGVLVSLQKNALNFIRFSSKVSRQRSI